VVLPVLLTFYLFFGVLEDSGYMPRLSILLDRLFRKMGMNGKGVLPLIMGFSCITMAILTTRMLDTKKEKIIATLLLIMGIPCAPLLAVMFVVFSKVHWSAMFIVFGIIALQILIVGMIANRLVPGRRGDFIIEVPPIRIPGILLVLRRAFLRTYHFMVEAVPVFLGATAILFVFDRLGGLDLVRYMARPVVSGLLGLPEQGTEVLIMTVIRREAGAALLDQFHGHGFFNGAQTVVTLLVMTFLMPCVNAIIVIIKERGVRTALSIMAFVIPYAVLVGTVINLIFRLLNVTF
jgi:ferrous iron transport protein B